LVQLPDALPPEFLIHVKVAAGSWWIDSSNETSPLQANQRPIPQQGTLTCVLQTFRRITRGSQGLRSH
jgi:hypothetical protein